MRQLKPFLTHAQQLDFMEQRGLEINDRTFALKHLRNIGYYRLSGYTRTLLHNKKYKEGTTFRHLIDIYKLDNDFRLLILRYTHYIEITFKADISYYHSKKYTSTGYRNPDTFYRKDWHQCFIGKLDCDMEHTTNDMVLHYKRKYGGQIPLWVCVEVMTFGEIARLYQNLKKEEKKIFTHKYNLSRKQIDRWIESCVNARNTAAHCGRFYNRPFTRIPVLIHKKQKHLICNSSAFAFVYVIYRLLPEPELRNKMIEDLEKLFEQYKDIDINPMGFSTQWKEIMVEN